MAIIENGGAGQLGVDSTPKAARIIPYDSSGNAGAVANRAAVTETTGGLLNAGKDYKLSRTMRTGSTGALQIAGDDTILHYDTFEGTTRNSNLWIETATTQASAQAAATGLTLNSAATTTTTTGILESSHRQFPIIARTGLVFRAKLRVQGATNCVEEWGFSDQSSATAAGHSNGAFFRRDATGALTAVLAFNAAETSSTTFSAVATTDYNYYEVWLEDNRATFQVLSPAGALIDSRVMEIGQSGAGSGSLTQARMFTVTHLPCFLRTLNTGAAGTAPQIVVSLCTVQLIDAWSQRPHQVQQAGMQLSALTSPTTYAQLANWSNSAAPTTRTLSNTAAAETTLGGLLRVNSIAGGNTDYIMFGFQNPTPYTLYVDGIWIPPPMNEVVAVATTATIFTYFAQFNTSAVSLATGGTYPGVRVALPGIHTAAVALAANTLFSGNTVQVTFPTPYAVQPGRFFHIGTRELVGTATATETYLWGGVGVTGFFE